MAELGEEYEDLQRGPTYDKDEHDDTHHLNNLQKPLQYHYLFKSKSIELINYLQQTTLRIQIVFRSISVDIQNINF